MVTLESLAAASRELANDLFRTDNLDCNQQTPADGRSCLTREEERPLTRAEKAKGWVHRPFFAYDENKLCNGCLG